jgi:hypothetical protein
MFLFFLFGWPWLELVGSAIGFNGAEFEGR